MNNDIVISLQHLSKSYDGKEVLSDVSIDIREGEFVTLLGPSGCGKTTTLRLIAGFLAPDQGRILLDGKDISSLPPYKRPFNTVFQRYALFPHLDVYDNIAFGLKLQKVPTDEIDKRVRRILKMVSMTDYESRDVESLSGGQQQRVAIARALVNRPRVLLLDEPLAALDLKMRKDMQIELKEMHAQLGITFIYVTHDQEEALTLSDTIVVMNEGRILQTGSPEEIYNEPRNSFVADFIGESNVLNGRMISDRKVEFIGHEFECVDEGFGENVPVDVVVRPEDIYIGPESEGGQFKGTVRSCTFKGVHYEMYVDTDTDYEIMIQDYNAFPVGSVVAMHIKPFDIQVMSKERLTNSFPAEVLSGNRIELFGEKVDCEAASAFEPGDSVIAEVDFDKVELVDHQEDGMFAGEVHFLLYKGDHYHITVITEDGEHIWVDTDDIWDKGDLVGINLAAENIRLRKNED